MSRCSSNRGTIERALAIHQPHFVANLHAKYTMRVERRGDFCKMMEANGIMASQLHHRSDTHGIFKESKRELPNMEDWYAHFVHIPCGWWVSDEDREKIVAVIKKGW